MTNRTSWLGILAHSYDFSILECSLKMPFHTTSINVLSYQASIFFSLSIASTEHVILDLSGGGTDIRTNVKEGITGHGVYQWQLDLLQCFRTSQSGLKKKIHHYC